MRALIQQALLHIIDWIYAMIPREIPSQSALHDCKIVSHRGENDNREVIENTLQAFRIASEAGVWGLECDIRWSRDLVPLIHHDASCERLFGDPVLLRTLDAADIRKRFPLIPTLAEVLAEFGGSTHLMLEIKAEHYPEPARQKHLLQALLSPLQPGTDYHFLVLEPGLAQHVDFVPRHFCVLVAEFNMARLSRQGMAGGFGGISGHFLLLNRAVKARHTSAGQSVGVGFISSRNSLFRELDRGVDWIFSNDALKIQRIRDRYLSPPKTGPDPASGR